MICLLAASLACNRNGKKDDRYQTVKVDRGDVVMTVTATGTLSAVKTVQIGSQVSGVIARLYADFNSRVHQGQLLAELDPTPFQAQVEQRMADVTKARVETANAKITFNRQQRLLSAGLAAQADLDGAQAAFQGASAQVQQATAALSQAQTNLRYARIISPIDGIVVDRQYDVGQTVAASFQAPTLFSLAQDLTKMQVQADVDQSDIGRIQVGQVARFTVDAFPDEEFRGKIAQIRLNATVAQNVVSYPVIIEVPNLGDRLRPKMTANVTIEVSTVRDVLRIPNAALRFKPDTSREGGGKQASSTAGAQGNNAGGGNNMDRAAARMGQGGRGIGGAAAAFGGGPRPKRPQTIYVLDANKKLQVVSIRTGISDGHFTQVVDGKVTTGAEVVVGLTTTKNEGPAAFGGEGGPGRPSGGGRGPR